jgi:hypothetical protein
MKLKQHNTMKNNFLKLFFVLMTTSAFSQVGINTQTPKATFEVVGKPDDANHFDGIIPPVLQETRSLQNHSLLLRKGH